mmetsp:Transcript_113489/g.308257  ORF Transcript_113489/g.308257 Transcript_113489/m.308257 type:complete len:230 (+) Transcript_113489:576-1265(+)
MRVHALPAADLQALHAGVCLHPLSQLGDELHVAALNGFVHRRGRAPLHLRVEVCLERGEHLRYVASLGVLHEPRVHVALRAVLDYDLYQQLPDPHPAPFRRFPPTCRLFDERECRVEDLPLHGLTLAVVVDLAVDPNQEAFFHQAGRLLRVIGLLLLHGLKHQLHRPEMTAHHGQLEGQEAPVVGLPGVRLIDEKRADSVLGAVPAAVVESGTAVLVADRGGAGVEFDR